MQEEVELVEVRELVVVVVGGGISGDDGGVV